MGYDLAKTSLIESEQSDAAVKLRGRDRKTTFGYSGKTYKNFRKQFRFTPVISPICGESCFTVKTADFCRFPFVEMWDDLCNACIVSVEKFLNSAGLERDFSGKNEPFRKTTRNEVKSKMITSIKKKNKLTEIWFDETGSAVTIRTYNTDLKNRLTAYTAKYPAYCRLTDDDECGCLIFEIDRRRFSVRLTAPSCA